MSLFTKVFGTRFKRELKRIRPIVEAIHRHEEAYKGYSEGSSRRRPRNSGSRSPRAPARWRPRWSASNAPNTTARPRRACGARRPARPGRPGLRPRLRAALDALLPEAYATVREAARRLLGSSVEVTGHALTWDMVPYDVQLIGGIVLHQGKIAEMATGEGKTSWRRSRCT